MFLIQLSFIREIPLVESGASNFTGMVKFAFINNVNSVSKIIKIIPRSHYYLSHVSIIFIMPIISIPFFMRMITPMFF